MPSVTPSAITLASFNSILARYPSTVPAPLRDLDTKRYVTIPGKVADASKKDSKDTVSLEKEDLVSLVEWKLKHGTFRPQLLQLVQSNPTSTITSTTTSAFKTYLTSLDSPLPALKILTQLKGIGPATASLILSVFAPDDVPFFSDELFRWVMWEEKSGGMPGGWKRRIKYNVKEYEEVVKRVKEVRERLGGQDVRAVDLEKVAWVLGKEGRDVGGYDGGDDEEVEVEGELEDVEAVKVEKAEKKKKGLKRKGLDADDGVSAPRRSSRRKVAEGE